MYGKHCTHQGFNYKDVSNVLLSAMCSVFNNVHIVVVRTVGENLFFSLHLSLSFSLNSLSQISFTPPFSLSFFLSLAQCFDALELEPRHSEYPFPDLKV